MRARGLYGVILMTPEISELIQRYHEARGENWAEGRKLESSSVYRWAEGGDVGCRDAER